MSTVYLNGSYIPKDEATISVDDRGFLLSDGVYEVTPFYEGVPFYIDRHLERLAGGLDWMRIGYDPSELEGIHAQLITRNGLERAESSLVYIQVTRGAAPRTHYFPTGDVEPTVYAYAKEWSRPDPGTWAKGFRAVTVPDRRWMRVDVKTICLLPNVLAFQAAKDAGVDDAILVRDGVAIEGAHQNLFGVFDGTLVTHPKTNLILPGITRGVLLELAKEQDIPLQERPIAIEELASAEELFFSGTTGEVHPCVEVDGKAVGTGTVGPVTRQLFDALLAHIAAVQAAATTVT